MEIELIHVLAACYFTVEHFKTHKEDEVSALFGQMVLLFLFVFFLPEIALILGLIGHVLTED